MPSLFASSSYGTPGAPFPGYGTVQRYPCIPTPCFTKSNTMAANKLYATRFYVKATTTFSKISVYQNSAATTGNIRLGIYNDSTSLPGTRQQDVGAVAFPGSTGWREVTASIALNGGFWYWAACVADAALVTIGPDLGSNVTQQSITIASVMDSGLSTVIGGSPDWSSNVNGIGAVRGAHVYGALPTPFPTLEAYDYNVPPMIFLQG